MFGMYMGKVYLKVNIDSEFENSVFMGNAIKVKNKIFYKEKDISVTIFIYKNKIEMKRYCKEYQINLIFDKSSITKSTYKLFNMDKEFILNTKTIELNICDNNIYLEYDLEGNIFKYNLVIGG